MLISFSNVVDTKLILEFKNNFRKYHLVFPKKNLNGFLGRSVEYNLMKQNKCVEIVYYIKRAIPNS